MYRHRNPKQRPQNFRLNISHCLANNLLFAGLGRYSNSTYYHDSSLYNYNGILTGMSFPVTSTTGWIWDVSLNRYILRYRNSYVTTTCTKSVGDFTACCWYRASGEVLVNYDRVLDKSYSTGFVFCRNGSSANSWSAFVVDSSASYPITITQTDGIWHHIAIVRSGSLVTVIGDGGSQVNSLNRVNTALSTTALHFGWSSVSENYNYFSGSMCDQMFWGRALSNDEIYQIADRSNVMLSGLILPPKRKYFTVTVTTTVNTNFPIFRSRIIKGSN